MLNKFIYFFIMIIMTGLASYAQSPKHHVYYEKDYQKAWCDAHSGSTEVVLPDKARVDCVTSTHAIEFDFAVKWAESIGQAQYYGTVLGKFPGIVLIVEDVNKDMRYVERVRAVANKNTISLWLMYPEDMNLYKLNKKTVFLK